MKIFFSSLGLCLALLAPTAAQAGVSVNFGFGFPSRHCEPVCGPRVVYSSCYPVSYPTCYPYSWSHHSDYRPYSRVVYVEPQPTVVYVQRDRVISAPPEEVVV